MKNDIKREHPLISLRNIGIMAHIDAGKTTTTERILYLTKKIHKIGEVHDGSAQMDWMAQEQERGITITSAATTAFWRNYQINIIDTPGHVDFTVEVERSLRVLDGSIALLDAQSGVEPQTETVWRQASKYKVPRIFFINKMDKIGADFFYSLKTIEDRLGAQTLPLQIPIGKENDFKGIIDIITLKAYDMDGSIQENIVEIDQKDIDLELLKIAKKWRAKLVEFVIDKDDSLFEKYMEGIEPSNQEIKKIIRQEVLKATFFPSFCGSAFKNKGVKFLLDGVIDYLPSPLDIEAIKGVLENNEPSQRICDDSHPFSALAFKIMSDPFVNKLTFVRIYSGQLHKGSYVYNSTKQKKERIARILKMHANSRTEVDVAYSGEIVALVGLKNTTTGDTICDLKNRIILEKMVFPEPVISLALEPKTKADQVKMSDVLTKLSEEDPTFKTFTNKETNQVIIAGMGELHLEILVDRMRREFKVNVNVGQPQVSYRETFTKEVSAEGKFIKQSGGRGQYGHVVIKFEPNKDKGFEFINKIVGGRIPNEYIKPVKEGLIDALNLGVIAGYPLIDVKATLYDGSYHDVDSSELAFKIAASKCLKNAAQKANPLILEPIMDVEIIIPDDYYGDVIGNIASKRGKIENTFKRANTHIIKGFVPLSEMFGYATLLRSLTQGRGTYIMQFSHYQYAPRFVMEKIIKSVEAK